MGNKISKAKKPVLATVLCLSFAVFVRLSFSRRGRALLRIDKSDEVRDTLSIARCGTIGFLTYFLPFYFLRGGEGGPTRSALAFGTFTGMYRLLRVLEGRYISDVGENVLIHRYGAGLCGAVAAYCGLIVDPSFGSSLFVIWWFIRSLRSLDYIEQLEKR